MTATLFYIGESISVINSKLFSLKCLCEMFWIAIKTFLLTFKIFANITHYFELIYTYCATTFLYLRCLGTIHNLEATMFSFFLYVCVELYSILYTLEGTYTPLLYILGVIFRPACGIPMSVYCIYIPILTVYINKWYASIYYTLGYIQS